LVYSSGVIEVQSEKIMPHAEFVHLHNHTEYSLLDGACRVVDNRGQPAEFIKLMASYKMPALAITDHGNMFGAVEFYSACQEAGIKPIIGCEVYLAGGSRFKKDNKDDRNFHLVLLAEDNQGYENLMQIVTSGYLEGFYYKPRIDKEVLKTYSNGLICLSGCLNGEVQRALMGDNKQLAQKLVEEYKSIFGSENFYLEVMDNGMPEQKQLIPRIIDLGKQTGTPLVATNDCHYLRREDAFSHDVLLCIGTGVTIDAAKRLKFPTDEFYYKTPAEMLKLFDYVPEAIKKTVEISERCTVKMNFNQLLLPYYKVPSGEQPGDYLRKLCREGLKRRYEEVSDEINSRLERELSVIEKMKFAQYFLIVWDFVQYAKKNSIPVGPGRGSGAGSLVAYCLGITDICPMTHGLLFERFLNVDRRTMPDLDIDFADYGRDTVIDYVRQKYGEKNVAQIITFGSMQSRLVIRDVARVLGFSVAEADRIAKLIPHGTPIFQSLNTVPELSELHNRDERVKHLLDVARKLEGLKRHQGLHAAGLVIAKDDITKFTPLARATQRQAEGKEISVTQYNDDALIKLGLLKIDFLGLRTLTVIDTSVKLIVKRHDKNFDLSKIPLDDKKTFKLFKEAKTAGIFQLESSGMRDLLRKLRPTVFEDIIALLALYRPGPMGSGMLDEFVTRKHQRIKIKYDHPLLEPIVKETYGVIVYQEQVMKIATQLAGFTEGQADLLRRAMAKKIREEIEQQEENFCSGAKKNNIDRAISKKIFEQIVHFGGYGFNKSHAAAYGLIAYQTAYLKANYPLEYMSALLSSEIGRSSVKKEEEDSKLVSYIREAKNMGIEILSPEVQKSDVMFSIEGDAIRFGLLSIKNVGELAAKNIVSVRRRDGTFKNLLDFYSRTDTRQVNRRVLESLIKAGAFDFLGLKLKTTLPAYVRARAMAELEKIYSNKDEKESAQTTLFESPAEEVPAEISWPDHVVLGYEKEVLGFYLSGHPLAQYRQKVEQVSSHKIEMLSSNIHKVRIAGIIASIKRLTTREKGEKMAKFRLENFDGEVDVLVFPKDYSQKISKLLNPNELVVVEGRVSRRDDKPTIIALDVIPLDKFEIKTEKAAERIYLKMSSAGVDDAFIEKLKNSLDNHPGQTQVYLKVNSRLHDETIIEIPKKVEVSQKLYGELEKLLGEKSWEIVNGVRS